MDQKTHGKGPEIRKAVLGASNPAGADSFRIAREMFAEPDQA